MTCLQKSQERRIKQRRRLRAHIKFPMTDGRGCIIPFDRSRITDRRLENSQSVEMTLITAPNDCLPNGRKSEDISDISALPLLLDSVRDFSISGELIASTNNIYNSQSPGKWKELELYLTTNAQYVCLEIWRTTFDGKYDQYWLATCNDLESAREFFGNNSLANDLFCEIGVV